MYTPIILPADLNSVMYPEIQDEISRADSTIVTEAIDIAIGEVKMYLTRYDIVKLFGDSVAGTSATFTDSFLTRMVKNIAMWHFIQLANVNINYESQKLLYEQTIHSLKDIQKGVADPQWPYQDNTTNTDRLTDSDQVTINSNELRQNYY